MDKNKVIQIIGSIALAVMSEGALKQLFPEAQILAIGFIGIAVLLLIFYSIKGKGKSNDVNLHKHTIFQTLEDVKGWSRYTFKLNNIVKTEVFRDILNNVLIIYRDSLKTMVNEVDGVKDNPGLDVFMHRVINTILVKITTYHHDNDNGYSVEDRKTLVIAISKFLDWHTKDTARLYDKIKRICRDAYLFGDLQQNKVLMLTCFEDLILDLKWAVMDAVDEMNGHLKYCTFRNKLIGE